jgi:Calcineurin-like phosphoesterase
MRLREYHIVFKLFLMVLIPFVVVIIIEKSVDTAYLPIQKYPLVFTGSSIHLQIIGDFGELSPNVTYNQTIPAAIVAHKMQQRAQSYPIVSVFSVGDNFYPNISSVNDPIVYKFMYEIFDQKDLQGKPWFLLLGNHDYQGNPYNQILLNELYPMWNIPDFYYNLSIPIDSGNLISFIFLDGVVLEGQNSSKKAEQYEWLEKLLEEQANDERILWKVVLNHMAIFSASTGHADSEILKQELFPLLYAYHIDIYVAGHSHVMSHFVTKYDTNPPNYQPLPKQNFECEFNTFWNTGVETEWKKGSFMHEVIQGGGGADLNQICPYKTTTMSNLTFGSATYGFSDIFISSDFIEVNYFGILSDSPLYTFRVWNV